MVLALLGVCTPTFWLGLMLILVFSVRLAWLPSFGQGGLDHLVLPASTLGVAAAAIIARVTRSSMLEVLSADYLRTARAKGLSEQLVVARHALKNALIPVVALVGVEVGSLLGGTVLIEYVFNWPGLSTLLVNGAYKRDYPVVQAVVVVIAVGFILINLLVDILNAYLDPRIRYQ
jgi:peptide/nickel transport system permease protein/oligopeptide transport system permease protein